MSFKLSGAAYNDVGLVFDTLALGLLHLHSHQSETAVDIQALTLVS